VKVGDLVKPSSQWEGHRFLDEKDLGVGIVTEVVVCGGGNIQCHIMWSSEDAYNTWEYNYELEVTSEGR